MTKESKSTKHCVHREYKGETNALKKEDFENLQGKLKMCVRDCVEKKNEFDENECCLYKLYTVRTNIMYYISQN